MTKMYVVLLAASAITLQGCQKNKYSTAQAKPTQTNFQPAPSQPLVNTAPNGPGGGGLPPDTTRPRYPQPEPGTMPPPSNPPPVTSAPPPRFPQPEPRDPVVVIPPTTTTPPPSTTPPRWTPTDTPTPSTPPITSEPPPVTSTPPPVIDPPPSVPNRPVPPPIVQNPPPPSMPVTPAPVPPPPTRTAQMPPETPIPWKAPKTAPLPPVRPKEFSTTPSPPAAKVVEKPVASAPQVSAPTPAPKEVRHIDPVDASCEVRDMKAGETKQMDILFVVDTSASLVKGPQNSREGGELSQIAAQMPAFVNQLPPDTNIRIGVLLGHGPGSPYFGKPFAANGGATILDSTKMSKQQMWTSLKQTMSKVPNDPSEAQGEALLMSLYEALTKNYAAFNQKGQGLFRANTNTVIIHVTDEQDVCWNYPGTNYPSTAMTLDAAAFARGQVPVLKALSEKKGKVLAADIHEMNFFKNVCQNFVGGKRQGQKYVNGQPLTVEVVKGALDSLAATTHAKVVMNGIVYKSNDGLSAMTNNEDENEMAHGTLDLIQALGEGMAADMKEVDRKAQNVDFSKVLTLLGNVAGYHLKGGSVFNCHSNYNPQAIDLNSLEVLIRDNQGRDVMRLSRACETSAPCQQGEGGLNAQLLPGDHGQKFLKVTPLDASAFIKQMKDKGFEGGQYEIKFRTKADFDTKTGKPVNDEAAVTAKASAPTTAKTPSRAKAKGGSSATQKSAANQKAQRPI